MSATFPKGLHPKGRKELSENIPITEFLVPSKLYVPLQQHIGAPAKRIVADGEQVRMGQMIAQAASKVSANIFSPVSGTVLCEEMRNTADGNTAHLVIQNDYKDEESNLSPLTNPSKEDIIKRIFDAGIVGMGGAGFPASVKLSPPKPVDTLIINGAECEPYITADYRIMLELTADFVQGCRYLMRALSLKSVFIGIENNKQSAIDRINEFLLKNNISDVTVAPLTVKYPQGAEKQLIYAVTGRKVPDGGLPYDIGVIVQNVHTALSTCYAVEKGQTLYKRIMTVSGGGTKTKLNAWVRTGTLYSEIYNFCGVYVTKEQMEKSNSELKDLSNKIIVAKRNKDSAGASALKSRLKAANIQNKALLEQFAVKLISGGPMMGIAVSGLDISVTKTTSCLLFLSGCEANLMEAYPCIQCSKCARVCPMILMPMFIDNSSRAQDYADAKKYGAVSCILCGCCAYICPSKRPLVQSIQVAKKAIREKGI